MLWWEVSTTKQPTKKGNIHMKKWYSGLNFIQVGTLLDLQEYLSSRHNYSVEDGVIYESEEKEIEKD